MRLYPASGEETLRARKLLKEWNNDRILSTEQYRQLEHDTPSDLRTTNVFLRVVLLIFTLIVVAAAVALFFTLTTVRPSQFTIGTFLLIFAALSYIAAEVAATHARLYGHGIEEALAIASIALVCAGLESIFSGSGAHSRHSVQFVLSAAGAVSSLWVWHRFGLWYALPAAMIFAVFLPECWTTSPWGQRFFLCVLYAAGLAFIYSIRGRHRFDYLAQRYTLAEAFLWLGIYLALNLKLSGLGAYSHAFGSTNQTSEFAAPFYWTTWVLLWCLPPIILLQAIRQKTRPVLAVGMLTTVLTLVTNKPYLGWQRHTWDPMLLGIALVAIAMYLRRWLGQAPGGIRHGFTAAPLSTKHKRAMSAASSAFSFVQPHSITPAPQARAAEPEFGGGADGAGASGDF